MQEMQGNCKVIYMKLFKVKRREIWTDFDIMSHRKAYNGYRKLQLYAIWLNIEIYPKFLCENLIKQDGGFLGGKNLDKER